MANLDVVYAEDFFQYLKNIQNSNIYAPSISPIPSDAPTIEVNLNTRKINIEDSEYKDFLSLREDHRAETVYFEVDRYFEDVDLNNCSCVVQYINLGAPKGVKPKLRIYPITLKDLETKKRFGKMILAWNIGGEATEYSGNLMFSLIFYKVNEIGDRFLYSLHTMPAQGYVLHGMDYSEDQKIESDYYYTLADQNNYESLFALINQKNVYWNDL